MFLRIHIKLKRNTRALPGTSGLLAESGTVYEQMPFFSRAMQDSIIVYPGNVGSLSYIFKKVKNRSLILTRVTIINNRFLFCRFYFIFATNRRGSIVYPAMNALLEHLFKNYNATEIIKILFLCLSLIIKKYRSLFSLSITHALCTDPHYTRIVQPLSTAHAPLTLTTHV